MLVNDRFGLEYIKYKPDDTVPSAIQKKLDDLAKIPLSELTQEKFDKVDIRGTILKKTGILINFTLSPRITFFGAYLVQWSDPLLSKNHIFYGSLKRWWELSDGMDEMMSLENPINGEVDLINGKVTGELTTIPFSVFIEPTFFDKETNKVGFGLTMMLYLIGRGLAYFETISRLTKTNYILSAGVIKFFSTPDKVKRLMLLDSLKHHGINIENKEEVTNINNPTQLQTVLLSSNFRTIENEFGYNIYDSRGANQLADSYVVRMGYGASLLSLSVLWAWLTTNVLNYKVPIKNNTPLSVYNLLFLLLQLEITIAIFLKSVLFITSPTPISPLPVLAGVYLLYFFMNSNPFKREIDPINKRIEKIKNQLIDVVKDKNLSDETKRQILIQIGNIKKVEANYVDSNNNVELFWKWVFYPFTRKQINLISVNNNLENMVNNPLYANSAKLDLINKRVI